MGDVLDKPEEVTETVTDAELDAEFEGDRLPLKLFDEVVDGEGDVVTLAATDELTDAGAGDCVVEGVAKGSLESR